MKRLFYLVSDLKLVERITHELEHNGIKETNIHIVGEKSYAIKKAHLHEANLIQKTDLLPSLKRGALIGFALSIILSGIYVYVLPDNIKLNHYILVSIVIFGVIFGAWASSLIGVSVEDPIVEKFENYVKQGHYIMVVDSYSEHETEDVIKVINNHPETRLVGAE
jgi:hypothetical protein